MLAFIQDKLPCCHFIGVDIGEALSNEFSQLVKVKVILIKRHYLRKIFAQSWDKPSEKGLMSLDSVGVLSAYPNYPGVQ